MEKTELFEKYYDAILSWVIRDAPMERIEQYFEVNKISEEDAKILYVKAKAERVAFIRKVGMRKILIGIVPVFIALLLIFKLIQPGSTMNKRVWLGAFAAAAFGAYQCITGILDVVGAESRKGELANMSQE